MEKYTGGCPHDKYAFDEAMNRCLDAIKEDPNLVLHFNYESGFPIVMTKERRQEMIDAFDCARPKLNIFSAPLIFGTGGGANSAKDFKKIWEEPYDSRTTFSQEITFEDITLNPDSK